MIKSIIHIADIHIRTYRYHDEYNEVFEKGMNQSLQNEYVEVSSDSARKDSTTV